MNALKVLGIEYNASFKGITKIEDAINLQNKLFNKSDKSYGNDSITCPDFSQLTEEYEDSVGNILDRQTYLDLQKQGLL